MYLSIAPAAALQSIPWIVYPTRLCFPIFNVNVGGEIVFWAFSAFCAAYFFVALNVVGTVPDIDVTTMVG